MARKLKLSCYTTNYVLREIAAVEFTLKMSFQKVRDELIYCFADGILDEEEFVLLYDAYKSTNSIYPYWEYDEFSLDSLSSDECLADFRVEKDDIPPLAKALRLPGRLRCSQGTLCSGLECLCILLKRLAFPCSRKGSRKSTNLSKAPSVKIVLPHRFSLSFPAQINH